MVFKGGLGGARREGTPCNEVFDELVVRRERRGNVERDGIFGDEGDV